MTRRGAAAPATAPHIWLLNFPEVDRRAQASASSTALS
jgi:hypothetical protein